MAFLSVFLLWGFSLYCFQSSSRDFFRSSSYDFFKQIPRDFYRASFRISTGISLEIFRKKSQRISLGISLMTSLSRKTFSGVAPGMSLRAFQDLSWNFSQAFFRDFSWSSFWDWDLLIFLMKHLPRCLRMFQTFRSIPKYLEFVSVILLRFFRDFVQISPRALPGVPKLLFFYSLAVASLVLAEVFHEFISEYLLG